MRDFWVAVTQNLVKGEDLRQRALFLVIYPKKATSPSARNDLGVLGILDLYTSDTAFPLNAFLTVTKYEIENLIAIKLLMFAYSMISLFVFTSFAAFCLQEASNATSTRLHPLLAFLRKGYKWTEIVIVSHNIYTSKGQEYDHFFCAFPIEMDI